MSFLTILLIRHAEKPGPEWPGHGFTSEGIEDDKSLVIRGWQRAGAWAALFGTASLSGDYPRPSVIYAANPKMVDTTAGPSKRPFETLIPLGTDPEEDDTTAGLSKRPFETIIPLAAKLHIDPVIDFAKGREKDLAAHLAQLTGIVLVCWEHKSMVEFLLPTLIGSPTNSVVPPKWDKTRFDIVLRLDKAGPGAPLSFRQLFPMLLSGDSDVPLKLVE